MCGDCAPAALRGLDDKFHFVQRERGLSFAVWAPAIIGVDLDPVGAFSNLVADDTNEAIDAIGLLGALGHSPLRHVTLRSVTAGRDNGAGHYEHARAGDDALRHSISQADISITGSFRAKVTNGR